MQFYAVLCGMAIAMKLFDLFSVKMFVPANQAGLITTRVIWARFVERENNSIFEFSGLNDIIHSKSFQYHSISK